MRRRLLTRAACLAAAALLAAEVACSSDVDLPAKYHEDLLAQPTQVESSYDGTALRVTWQMPATTHVEGYVVAVTDTAGDEDTHFVEGTTTTYTEPGADLDSGTYYIIRLWAVDAADFFGPPSAPDTLVVP